MQQQRVKLIVDLTRYDRRLVVGQLGWTNPGDRSGWSSTDRFTKVQFDNGDYRDILWESLTVLAEPAEPTEPVMGSVCTVGDLQKILNTLPLSAPIRPVWLDPSVIDDACPAVTLCGFEKQGDTGSPYLAVKVDLSYPTDEDESYADGNDND